ncbi:hypothetical protein GFS31_08800 [Leptolyngbya sp. BL0902]|nr:hypothetical protein GFS31_08800 [Leptolyngbya sp. BL0902]
MVALGFPLHSRFLTMAKRRCPHCQSTTLIRLGVPGIRQCSHCKAYVDLRSKGWLKQLIGKKRAA